MSLGASISSRGGGGSVGAGIAIAGGVDITGFADFAGGDFADFAGDAFAADFVEDEAFPLVFATAEVTLAGVPRSTPGGGELCMHSLARRGLILICVACVRSAKR